MQHVLDVGNCDPDFLAIQRFLTSNFQCTVDQADRWEDARRKLVEKEYALVLVNRKLDCDYSDGIEVIKALKADPEFGSVPVMLVTNYEEHQAEAVAAGAEMGFGKKELTFPLTVERVGKFLPPASSAM